MNDTLQWDFSKPFWHQDIRVLAYTWFQGIFTLSQALLFFAIMSLSVMIPYFLMWALQVYTGRP